MGSIQRLTDSNSDGGQIDQVPQNTVFADNLLVAVNGSQGTGHGDGPHSYHAWATSNGSPDVYAQNISVNFTGNTDTCGDVRVGGSGNVFVNENQGIDEEIPAEVAVIEGDEIDVFNPGAGYTYMQQQIQKGTIRADEYAGGLRTRSIAVDKKLPANTAAVLTTNCADIASLTPFPTGNAIDAIQLTSNYTVGKLTRTPYVVFDNKLRSPTAGLSVEEICCNLKLLTINCIEPILAHYGNAVVTNTWREGSTGQHPKGQAADIQFRGSSKTAYFTIAQWIRDNIVYDQLLLEYKTTGSGLPWIHISFNKAANKKQVLTMLNDSKYSNGLTQLA